MATSNERSPEEKEQMQAFLSRKAEIPSGLFTEMPETNPIEKREQLLKQREQLLEQREQKLNEREQLLAQREQLLNRREQLLNGANHLLSNQDQLDQEAREFYKGNNSGT